MAERLQKFVEPLTEVPALLQRNYKLIRDLDEKVADLQQEMDAKCRAQLSGKAGAKRQRTEDGSAGGLPPEIEAVMQQALGLAEEKVLCFFARRRAARRTACQRRQRILLPQGPRQHARVLLAPHKLPSQHAHKKQTTNTKT